MAATIGLGVTEKLCRDLKPVASLHKWKYVVGNRNRVKTIRTYVHKNSSVKSKVEVFTGSFGFLVLKSACEASDCHILKSIISVE